MDSDINKRLQYYGKPIIDSRKELVQKRETWIKSILLLSSGLFGILISLHNTSTQLHYIRMAFAVSIALLGIGILLLSIALYGFVDILVKHHDNVLQESLNAQNESRELTAVATKERKIFSVCEKSGYFFLVSCVVSLIVYVFMLI